MSINLVLISLKHIKIGVSTTVTFVQFSLSLTQIVKIGVMPIHFRWNGKPHWTNGALDRHFVTKITHLQWTKYDLKIFVTNITIFKWLIIYDSKFWNCDVTILWYHKFQFDSFSIIFIEFKAGGFTCMESTILIFGLSQSSLWGIENYLNQTQILWLDSYLMYSGDYQLRFLSHLMDFLWAHPPKTEKRWKVKSNPLITWKT